jgi:hypothetical protein
MRYISAMMMRWTSMMMMSWPVRQNNNCLRFRMRLETRNDRVVPKKGHHTRPHASAVWWFCSLAPHASCVVEKSRGVWSYFTVGNKLQRDVQHPPWPLARVVTIFGWRALYTYIDLNTCYTTNFRNFEILNQRESPNGRPRAFRDDAPKRCLLSVPVVLVLPFLTTSIERFQANQGSH